MANTTTFQNVTDLEMTPKNTTTDDSDKSLSAGQVLSILEIIIGVIGIVGNALVIFVICKYTKIHKKLINIYVINQSLIDMVVAIFLVLTTSFQDTGKPLQGTGGEVLCKLWYTKTLLWSPFFSSIINLVFLTLARCVEIVHPLQHRRFFRKPTAYVSVVIAWLFGYVFNFSHVFSISRLVGNACIPYQFWPSKTVQGAMGVTIFVVYFFIPTCVFAFCYIKMALTLQRQLNMPVQSEDSNQSSSDHVDRKLLKSRKNIIVTFGIVCILFFLCWIGNQVYYLLFNLGHPVNFTSPLYHVTVIAVALNCCLKPFIYAFKFEEFQAGLKKMFKIKDRSDGNSIDTTEIGGK